MAELEPRRRWRLPLTVLLAAACAGCADYARRNTLSATFADIGPAPDDALYLGERNERLASALTDDDTLDLTDAFRLAIAHSEVLEIQGERILQADTLEAEAYAGLLPRARFDLRWVRDSDQVGFGGEAFQPQERTNHSVVLTQPLFDGRVLPGLQLAAAAEEVATLRLRDERDELLFQVASAFYEVLSLQQDVESLQAARSRADEFQRVLEVQLQVGAAQEQDVLLSQARRSEIEANLIEAEHDLARARLRLARRIGMRDTPPTLVDTLQVEPPKAPAAELVRAALGQRYDLATARAQVDQAQAQRSLALADYLPSVALDFTQYTRAVGGFTEQLDWTVGVNVMWNIFDGGGREARAVRAASVARERELMVEALEKDVWLEVHQAVHAFQTIDRSMEAFQRRAQAAAGAERLATAQYQAGEATNLDVLTSQQELQGAERNLARARYARKLAALRIWLASGQLRRSAPVQPLGEMGE